MAEDNNDKSKFSISRMMSGLRGGSDERSEEELSEDAAVKSFDGSDAADVRRPFSFEQPDYDRTEAPKDEMRKYWRQFETTPIVRKPITSFASRVTEPGYYIETASLQEEEVEQLGNWLEQCAIIEGQPGRDFRLLAKKAIVQREVRGTALVEVAPNRANDDLIAGLKLINAETMEAVTRPNQSILMAPDDLDNYEDAPKAESGGAAAWLQDVLETDQTYWGTPVAQDASGDAKIGFRRDEIIPLARDADVGEVFGTSRIEAVSDRIDGLKQKLQDNDEAIASKAYPLWLFMFGSEEQPWDSSDIRNFMKAHEMENFHPGMKQGVRGDVSVKTISGEVADIAEYLQFDLRWVMAAMPLPVFVLGSFQSASVGQISGIAQQRDVNRQIKEARRELEAEFTPVLRRVAKQQGIEEERAEDVTLRFGVPGQSDLEVEGNQQVIRYVSGSGGGGGGTQTQAPGQVNTPGGASADPGAQFKKAGGDDPDVPGDQNPNIVTKGETPSSVGNPTPDQKIAGVDEDANPFVDIKTGEQNEQAAALWEQQESVEELSDKSADEIAQLAEQVFRQTRDETLKSLSDRFEGAPQYAVAEFENIANRELNAAVREAALGREARSLLKDELRVIEEEYLSERQPHGSNQNVRFFAQNVENAVRDAAEEMLRRMRLQARNAVVEGASFQEVKQRIERDYSDARLSDRARLIGQMEHKNAVESTKLACFERNPDIIGVRVRNDNPSTPLTQELAGTEVMFDGEEDVSAVLRDRASSTKRGFDPLPASPPFHFNDTTELEPVYKA